MIKSKKKFVLAGLVLLSTVLLLPFAGCDTNSDSDRGITIQQPGNETSGSGRPQVTTCTVTFNANGGTFDDGFPTKNETVESGKTATGPTAPTKKQYEFDGWYSDEEMTTAYDFSTAVTKDITLYAKWSHTKVDSEVAVVVDSTGTVLKRESTLADAVTTALNNSGSTIYLVANVVGCAINGNDTESFTLDLNGRKVEGYDDSIDSYGLRIKNCKVTIKDSSSSKSGVISVSGQTSYGIICEWRSDVIVNGVNIKVTSYGTFPAGIYTLNSSTCRIQNSNIEMLMESEATPMAFQIENTSNGIILDGSVTIKYSSRDGTDCNILHTGSGYLIIAAGFKKPLSPLKVVLGGNTTKQETEKVFAKPESPEVNLDPSWFTSYVDGYHVEKDADGNLIMVKDTQ